MRVVVVGAGAIGANVAYRLCMEGCEVVLIEATEPAGGTSGTSFAWLSQFPQMAWDLDDRECELRASADRVFRDLERELPGEYTFRPGTLTWAPSRETDVFVEGAKVARSRGVDVRTIDFARAREIETAVIFPEELPIFWEPSSGWVNVRELVGALVAAIRESGRGLVLTGTRVVSIDATEDAFRSVTTDKGEVVGADFLVDAAGPSGAHVAAMAGLAIPLDLIPGRLIYTSSVDAGARPRCVIVSDKWEARPDPAGGLVIQWSGGNTIDMARRRVAPRAREVIEEVSRTVPVLAKARLLRSGIGIRPVPPNGPVIGCLPWVPNIYFALSHGGIGWGPMWGHVAAREIVHGEIVPELAGMRPERFYLGACG